MAQATSSHMMKTTKRGRPFLKDTHDLFATLIVSLELTTHKQFFKSIPNSFTTDEAAANLASLKFSQSNRGPDPRDPNRIITTTTTTTFSMTREMAKTMAQHFMDARLIENAADRTSNLFKERGVYQLTPKGLHVLERFIAKNGISADHLFKVFASQPICMKLLHLERRASDDEIIISQAVVTALFRRFVGRSPNYVDEAAAGADTAQEYYERSKGIPLSDVVERAPQLIGRGPLQTFKWCFSAVTALEWLCDFTSISGRDEAAEMAAHFVRFGLIALLSDKRKGTDQAVIFTVRGSNGPSAAHQGEFRCTAKAIYRITDEGAKVAKWDSRSTANSSPHASQSNLPATERPSTDQSSEGVDAIELAFGPGGPPQTMPTIASTTDQKIHRRISMQERLKDGYVPPDKPNAPKESNADRLKFILDEPALRSLFREFLRGNYCEENLSFWLEVQDFKRKFSITSTAMSGARGGGGSASTAAATRSTPGQSGMERHHERLIHMAVMIYNTYLKASSPCELNIDHGLRNQLDAYLNSIITEATGQNFEGRIGMEHAHVFNATQLQKIIEIYGQIQSRIFLLMADDSVPKFIKTKRFLALRNWVEEYEAGEEATNAAMFAGPPPGLEETDQVGRTYMTVSQQANEKVRPPQPQQQQSPSTQ